MAVQIPTRPPNRAPAVDPLDPEQIVADLESTGRTDSLSLSSFKKGLASGTISPEAGRRFVQDTQSSTLLSPPRPQIARITDEQAAVGVPLREGGTDRRSAVDRKREANNFIDRMNKPIPRDRAQLVAQVDAKRGVLPQPTVLGPAQRAVARAVDRSGFQLPRPDPRLPTERLRPVIGPDGIAPARAQHAKAVEVFGRKADKARAIYAGRFRTPDPVDTTIAPDDTPEAASLKAQALLAGADSGTLAATEAQIAAIRRDDEVPGFLMSAALAVHRGNLQIGEAGGTFLRFLGGLTGLDSVAELGEDIEAYMGPRQRLFTEALKFGDGNVLDNPEILLDGRRLFAEVAGFIPQLVGGGVIGAGVKVAVKSGLMRWMVRKQGTKAVAAGAESTTLKIGGKALDMADTTTQFKMIRLGKAMTAGAHGEAFETAARVAGAVGFGGFAGVLEGSSTYREIFDTLRAQGASPTAAREAAEMAFMQMTAASGLLNAFAINKILAPLNGSGRAKNAVKRLARGFWESVTEYLEEPAEILIKFGQDAITVEEAVQQLRDGTNVLLPAFTIGALLPGAGGDFITAGQFKAGATPDDIDVGTAESASNQIEEETGELPDEASPGAAGKAVSTLTDEEVGNAQAEQEDVDAETTQIEEGEEAPAPTDVADENAPDAVNKRVAKQGEEEATEALEPGEDFAEETDVEMQAELVAEAVELVKERELVDDEVAREEIDFALEGIEIEIEEIQERIDAQAVRDTEGQVQEAGAVTEGGGREGGEDLQQQTGRAEQATETDREGEQPRADAAETAEQTEGEEAVAPEPLRVKLTKAQISAIESRMDGGEQVDGLVMEKGHLIITDRAAAIEAINEASNAEDAQDQEQGDKAARGAATALANLISKVNKAAAEAEQAEPAEQAEQAEPAETMTLDELVAIADPNVPLDRLEAEEGPFLDNLQRQIEERGIERPIDVQVDAEGNATLIADGMHRLAVARRLGLETVPVRRITREQTEVESMARDEHVAAGRTEEEATDLAVGAERSDLETIGEPLQGRTLSEMLLDPDTQVDKAQITPDFTKAKLVSAAREAGIEVNTRDTRGIMINKLVAGQAQARSADRAVPDTLTLEDGKGRAREIKGEIRTRDNGERFIITKRGAVYEIDGDKVFKIRPDSHSQTFVGRIVGEQRSSDQAAPGVQRSADRAAPLNKEERAALDKVTAPLSPEEAATVEKVARADRKKFSLADGWQRLDVIGFVRNKAKKIKATVVREIAYTFHHDSATGKSFTSKSQARKERTQRRYARKLVAEVREVMAEARRGGKQAKQILAQQVWYSGVTRRLRQEFGGAADLVADLLGATSPRQVVKQNYEQTIDAVRQLSQGKFDTQMQAFHDFLNSGGIPSEYRGPTVTKINGKKYGINTESTMLALAKVWRAMPPGSAPKARNFTGNLIGISDMATIDMWAARLMQRYAFNNRNRIPPKAEKNVGGDVNKAGTRVGGAFGFAQDVFDIASAELGMTSKDLQAVAWFMEKRIWKKNGWSFAEGGSFLDQLDISSFDRLITGISIARPGFKPTKRDQLKIGARIRRLMTRLDAVSFRQASTIGSFLGDIERSFDVEATVSPGFDITALVNEMADIGQENTQDDVFVSRVLRPGEENPNARPGLEVFFKNQQSMKDAMVLLNTMTDAGIDGFTMVVDPRANPSTIEKGPNFIGVRVQFVPEFAARGDENFAKDFRENGIDGMLRQATLRYENIAEQLYEAGAASVQYFKYDTLVFGKENYNDYTTPRPGVRDQATDRVWFGTPISEGVEAAIVRIEAGKSNNGTDGVRRSSDEGTLLGSDTRGQGVASEGTERISSPPVRDDGKIELTHWSRQENIAELDPAQHGTGIQGAEARRKANNEDLYVDRTYYGIGVGREGGYVKERALGNKQYTASVAPGALYNWHGDPDGLMDTATAEGHLGGTRITRYEQLIKEAGYDGYWVSDPSLGMVAAVFNKLRTEVTPDANADPAQATTAAEESGASQVIASGNSETGTVQPSLTETDSTPSAAQGATLRLSNPRDTRLLDTHSKPGDKGMQADEVRFHILEHLQRLFGFVEIRVVQSVKDLPELLQTGTKQYGVYYEQPGKSVPTIYLVADNITTAAFAEEIILHEAVGHAGIRALPNFIEVIKAVQAAIERAEEDGNDPLLMEVVKEVRARRTVQDEGVFVEEVIAHLAQRSNTRGAAMKEVISALKQVLRNLGFTQTFTSTDIMGLIRASHTRMQARSLALSGLGVDVRSEEFQAVLKSKNLSSLRAAQTDQEIGESLEALAVELAVTRAIDTAGMEPDIDEDWTGSMNIPAKETPWQDRMKKAWDEFAQNETVATLTQGLIDSANAIKLGEILVFGKLLDASKSAYKALSTLKNLNNVMGAVMRHGIPEKRNGAFREVKGRMSFGAIFEPLAKIRGKESQVRNLEKYIVAIRARRLIDEDIAAGRQGTKQAREKNLEEQLVDRTIAWAQSQVAENGQTYAEIFDEVRANWQSLNSDNLDLAEQTGVITKEERAIWEQYGDYVPFWRDASKLEGRTAPGKGTGVSVESRGIQRLTGGVDREGDPLKLEGNVVESMFMNTAYLLDRSYRNEAMQRVAELGTNIELGKMRKVAQKAKPAITVENDEVAELLWKAGIINAKTLDDAIDEFNNKPEGDKTRWTTFWTRIKPPGSDIVTVWNKGKPTYYEADPMWLRSIRGAQGSEVGSWITAFRTSKKWLTTGVTIDPAFMLANWMRDTLQTFVVSDAPMVPIADALKGLKDAYQGDEALLTLAFAGRSGGEYYDSHPDDIRKLIKGLGVPEGETGAFMSSVISPQKMWRWWRRVGSASEFGNRVAVYKSLTKDREKRVSALVSGGGMTEEAAREQALSEGFASDAEAAYQAQDLLNFTRSGDYAAMQALIQMIPFLNARIQGLNRLWRGARDNPFHFMTRGAGLTMAGLALALINDDDERYRQLPEWDRDTYLHFFIGDEHFRIPKPFETGVIFLTVPERMVRLMSGEDGMKEFKQSMLHAVTETFVFNPVPQLGKPIIESYMNRSFFTDSPIVTLNEENLDPEAQYDFRTGEFAKLVAEGMPESAPEWLRSPKRLEHLVRGYFGAMGMYAMSFGNVMTESAVYGPSKTMDELTSQQLHELPVLKRFIQGKTPSTTKYNRLLWDMLKEADGLARTMKKYQNEQRFEDALGIRHTKRDILAIRPQLRKIASQVSKINALLNQNEVSNRSPDARRRVRDTLNARKIRLTRQIAPFIDLF